MGDVSAVLAKRSLSRLAAEMFPAIGKLITKVLGIDEKFEHYNWNWNQFMAEILEEHKKKLANSEEEDFVDVLLRTRNDGTAGFDPTENDIIAIVRVGLFFLLFVTFIFEFQVFCSFIQCLISLFFQDMTAAATDTTFISLEWIMSELMKNPDVMAKAQAKIRQIAGQKPMVTEDDLNQIGYVRAVIKETMRLHPPAPLLVPRESTTTTVIHGYEIPAKTKLIINAWAIGRDPQSWEAPEEFRPERFIGSEVNFKGNHFQFIPFGAGRRMCPGLNFAMVTIELALANLLYRFDWRLPGKELDMDEGVGISTPRKTPLYLIATEL
jgi:Cytochrome P450